MFIKKGRYFDAIPDAISGATFSAANALLLPIGIPYLMGRTDSGRSPEG